ncbi:MAG: hypothetical protein JWQ29_1086, partial [Phenylobacterium sp.]|nr:hypothetical protein [Phenylobacterium sp.]
QAVEAMAGSAYFQRYSKAPTYAYGPEVRAGVLAQAQAEHGAEIRRGLAWLAAAASTWPPIAAALAQGEGSRRVA